MNDMIEKMRQSNKSWYKKFFAECKWVEEHASQISIVGESGNSFCFGNAQIESKEESWESLKGAFKFLGKDEFTKKFNQAVSGGGHEWTRITRLHSSSLLPFLLFSQISELKPIKIEVACGQVEEFSKVRFEVRNWLEFKDRYPSNIDVVLENDDVILFLESKFTEYLTRGQKVEISYSRYGNRLGELGGILKDKLKIELTKSHLILRDNDKRCRYLTGVKQLLAHYMGLEYALGKGDNKYNQGGTEFLDIGNRKVYLGEVMFDCSVMEGSDAFDDYNQLYSVVAPGLLATSRLKSKPMILSKPLTYQNLFANFTLDKDVSQFYQLSDK